MTRAQLPRGVFAALALCALAAAGSCREPAAEEVESTTPVTVVTQPAVRGVIGAVVHAAGLVSAAPGAELIVVAPEGARVAEIPHAAGDRVRRGDVLVRFDIPGTAADVRRQQAEVTRAEATLENARAAQTRARGLFDRGVAARKEAEDATRSLADAEAALTQAHASLGAARSVEGRATVRATFDGVIARRFHNPGDIVEATSGDPVLRVIDTSRLEIVAAVPLSDASSVEVGAPAHLTHAPANAAHTALRVLSLPAAVDSGTATVPIRLGFAAPVPMPLGMPVQVEIEAEQRRDVVIVPTAAIVREGEEPAVFVVKDGKAHRRAVRLGLSDGTGVEVIAGVDAGERVIIKGQTGLPDAADVTEAPARAPGAEPPPAKGGVQ